MESLRHSTHLYGRRLVLEWAAAEEETVDALRDDDRIIYCDLVINFSCLFDAEVVSYWLQKG